MWGNGSPFGLECSCQMWRSLVDDVVVHVYPCQLMPHITQSGDLDGQCRTWMLLAYMYVVVSFDVWDRALINGVDFFHNRYDVRP